MALWLWLVVVGMVMPGRAVGAIAGDPGYMSCCTYCRSEPQLWVSIGGSFVLAEDHAPSKMDNPPAYMVDDEETVLYTVEDREYKLRYAGAPMKITHTDLTDVAGLIKDQYVEFDLASAKQVGGIMVQGGFHEEKIQGLFPYREGWATEFVASYANTTDNFHMYTNENGGIELFRGNTGLTDRSLASFSNPFTARFVRFHPLRAQNEEGIVTKVNIRVTVITCVVGICTTPRINCLLTEWAEWGDCLCSQLGCSRARTRTIRRVQACGGARCGDLKVTEQCEQQQPMWQTIVQWVGIALAVLILIAIIAFVVWKKTHQDRVEVIVVKDNDDDETDFRPRPRRDAEMPRASPFGMPPTAPTFKPSSLPRQPMPSGPRPGFGGGGANMFGLGGGIAPTD